MIDFQRSVPLVDVLRFSPQFLHPLRRCDLESPPTQVAASDFRIEPLGRGPNICSFGNIFESGIYGFPLETNDIFFKPGGVRETLFPHFVSKHVLYDL